MRAIPGAVPPKAAVPRIVRELVSFVSARIPEENDSGSYEPDWATWKPSNLPEGVAAIDIDRPSYHSAAYWFMPRSGMVPDLAAELLQKRIGAKNAKLRQYNAAPTENWLVLVVEGSAPSSTFTLTKGALEYPYESAFQKTFLFNAFARSTFELTTVRPPKAAVNGRGHG
jgi:hypothetical protein